jgi:hypothetical protein
MIQETKNDEHKISDNVMFNDITNGDLIRFVTQVFFSLVICVFAIFMIARSNSPSDETLWISLLTSSVALYTNPPSLHKK